MRKWAALFVIPAKAGIYFRDGHCLCRCGEAGGTATHAPVRRAAYPKPAKPEPNRII